MTVIVGNQQVAGRPAVVSGSHSGARAEAYDYSRRSDYLEEDMVDISSKKKKKEEKGVIGTACDAIGNGVKSFVNLTVNAFAKAASEVVVDKAVGKISGK